MKMNGILRTVMACAAIVTVGGTIALAQPKLEIVGGNTYDWGVVPPGKLTAAVQVKNTGSEELKITEVRPGCGCTAAPIDKNLLAPGDVGTINITLDVTTRSGPVEKYIKITSNDPTTPTETLNLKANVKRAITCSPMQYMLISNAEVGVEAAASPITIKNTSDAAITFQVPEIADGSNVGLRLEMTSPRTLKPGEEFAFNAFATPKEAVNPPHATLKIKTSSTEIPVLEITISGAMKPLTTTPTTATPQSPIAPVTPSATSTTSAPTLSGHSSKPH